MAPKRTLVVLLLAALPFAGSPGQRVSMAAPKGAPSPSAAAPRPTPAARPKGKTAAFTSQSMLNVGAFTSAEVCGGCHKDIHAGWAASQHARSFTDPAFTAALQGISAGAAADAVKACMGCHAPTTLVTKDYGAKDPLTREGITCSFCHAITGTSDKWSENPFTLDPGQTMRGPFQFASSPGHFTAYSPLHRTAQLCAPCHQLETPSGVAVLNTFEEWKAGPWPRQGVQCQDCHMALVPGAVAADIPKPAQVSAQDRRLINLHRLVGGTAPGQLRRALSATIREARRDQGSIVAIVEVKNDGAGHRAPTGLPTRSIVLRLEAQQNGKTFFSEERPYKRDLLDADGKKIVSDADAFLKAARVGADTRIGPGETRTERFSFAAPPGAARILVGVEYVEAAASGPPRRRERFLELTAEVR